jgi:AcrR family transcriptional regulator
MSETSGVRRGGRAREAAENDVRIFDAARRVLTADPRASVAAVGAAAGVGKSAIYLRYPSKEALLQRVAEECTRRFTALIDEAHDALDAANSASAVLDDFLAGMLDLDIHAFMWATNGTYTPTDDDVRASRLGNDRGLALVARFHDAGVLRSDATWNDLNDWISAISTIASHDPDRVPMRRRRMLSALRPGLEPGHPPLSGTSAKPIDFWPPDVKGFAGRDDIV